jgi:hypothetical protein
MTFESTFPVGRFEATVKFDTDTKHIAVQWSPDVPCPGELSKEDLRQYQNGRNSLLAKTGIEILLVE